MRHDGRSPIPVRKPTLGYVAEQFLVTRKKLSTYGEIKYIIEGEDGIFAFFGQNFDLSTMQDTDVMRFKSFLDRRSKKPTFKRFNRENARKPENIAKVRGTSGQLLSNARKDKYLVYLRALLNKAKKLGVIDYVPEIVMYGEHGKRELVIDIALFCKVFSLMPVPTAACAQPHRAMLLMEIFTGQRLRDLTHMETSQIVDSPAAGCRFRYKSSKTGKGWLWMTMPSILAEELTALEAVRDPNSTYLFPNPKTGKPYTSIKHALKKACERLGVDRFDFYQFRHLTGTEYLRHLKDVNAVANILGHRSSKMVEERYGHPTLQRIEPGIQKINAHLQTLIPGNRSGEECHGQGSDSHHRREQIEGWIRQMADQFVDLFERPANA